ncbi:TPA: hypothetical protein VDW51_002664, partial [Pseudomonas aeruginosa]|nr:hypothetical protein [Pseudomonas aeruginosa]
PLNDKVNEKTTLLNDTSSRYNSAVEALNRFIQKYDSVLRDILSAI